MAKRYLSDADLQDFVSLVSLESFVPMSQDSYNETLIREAIVKTKKEAELCMAAINMACIGYGNKKYGNFKFKEVVYNIAELLTNNNVKIGLSKDAKLADGDLTPQRLCRFYRVQIREFIETNKFETYIFRKYSDHNVQFANILFRGAEYLELDNDQREYLTSVYQTMDGKLQTNLTDRINRVFQAKGLIRRTFE